ncbi:hypothetical protein K2X33_02585 [bacterium]|nr:hypothetical protein [bacterium]
MTARLPPLFLVLLLLTAAGPGTQDKDCGPVIAQFEESNSGKIVIPTSSSPSAAVATAVGAPAVTSKHIFPSQDAQRVLAGPAVHSFRERFSGKVAPATRDFSEEMLRIAAEQRVRTEPEDLLRLSENQILNLQNEADFLSHERMENALARAPKALEQGELAFVLNLASATSADKSDPQLQSAALRALQPFFQGACPPSLQPKLAAEILDLAPVAIRPDIPAKAFSDDMAFREFLASYRLSAAAAFASIDGPLLTNIREHLQSLRTLVAEQAPGLDDRLGGNQVIPDTSSPKPQAILLLGGVPVRVPLPAVEVGRANIASRTVRQAADGHTELVYSVGHSQPNLIVSSAEAAAQDAQNYSNLTGKPTRAVVLLNPGVSPTTRQFVARKVAVETERAGYSSAPPAGKVFRDGAALNPAEQTGWYYRMRTILPSLGTLTRQDLADPRSFRLVTVQPGETVIQKGQRADSVIVVPTGADGALRVDGVAYVDDASVLGATGVLRQGLRNATIQNTSDKPITLLMIEGAFYRDNISDPRSLAEVALEQRSKKPALPAETQAALLDAASRGMTAFAPENFDFQRAPPDFNTLMHSVEARAVASLGRPVSPQESEDLRRRLNDEISSRLTPFELAQTHSVLRDQAIRQYIEENAARDVKRIPESQRAAEYENAVRAGWEMVNEIRRLSGSDDVRTILKQADLLESQGRSGTSSLSRRRDSLALGRRSLVDTDSKIGIGDFVSLEGSGDKQRRLYVDALPVEVLRSAGEQFAREWSGEPLSADNIATFTDAARAVFAGISKAELEKILAAQRSPRPIPPGSLTEAVLGKGPKSHRADELAFAFFLQGAGLDARLALTEPASGSDNVISKPAVFVHFPTTTYVHSGAGAPSGPLHTLRNRIRLSPENAVFTLGEESSEARSKLAVIAAQNLYRAASAAGHPHAKFLEEFLGFRFGKQTNQIETVPLDKAVQKLNGHVDELVASGRIPASGTIRPARVFRIKEGDSYRYVAVGFGDKEPPGAQPVTGIVPFRDSLRMLTEGWFVLGENSALGPRNAEHLGTVALHDLAHHSVWHQNPDLMVQTREAARRLYANGAYYKHTPSSFTFGAEHVHALRENNLLEKGLAASLRGLTDAQAAAKLNAGPPQTRLDNLALLIESGALPDAPKELQSLPAKAHAGLRFTLWLENAFEIPKGASQRLFGQWNQSGWIPPSDKDWSGTRNNVADVKKFLEAKAPSNVALGEHLRDVITQYQKSEVPVGGMPRDIFQEQQRRNEDPQGFGYYSTPRYLIVEAERLLDRGVANLSAEDRAKLVDLTARLQVTLLEAGRFTATDWLRDITQSDASGTAPRLDPKSEVARFFTETGVFPRDLYYSAHGGELVTPQQKKEIAVRKDPRLLGAGAVSEIGAGMKIAEVLGKTAQFHAQPYKMAASDREYNDLGTPATATSARKDGDPGDYASRKRLEGQLDTEFDRIQPNSSGVKYAMGVAAETNRGEGHAWVGIKAQLTPGGEPITLQVHLRLNANSVSQQQEHIGNVGLNLVHSLYLDPQTGTVNLAKLLEGTKDTSIDFIAVGNGQQAPVATKELSLRLVREGAAPGIVFDGKEFKAPRDAAALDRSKTDLFTLPEKETPDSKSKLDAALESSEATGRPLVIVRAGSATTSQAFLDGVVRPNPKPREARTKPDPNRPAEETVERKAVALNALPDTLFSLVHVGPTPAAPVKQVFDARNVRNLFFAQSTEASPRAAANLEAEVDKRLSAIHSNRPSYARVAMGTQMAPSQNGGVEGVVLIKGQRENGGPMQVLRIPYKFSDKGADENNRRVQALGVNALYYFTRPGTSEETLRHELGLGAEDSINLSALPH